MTTKIGRADKWLRTPQIVIWLLLPATAMSGAEPSTNASPLVYQTEMTTAGNEKWRGKLFLTDEGASAVRGCFVWRAGSYGTITECVSGEWNADRNQLRLHTGEVRTRHPGFSLAEYEATVDATSTNLIDGKKINPRNPDQAISWQARPLRSSSDTTDPAVASWLAPTNDRQWLLRELSDSYTVGSTLVIRRPLMSNLRELMNSSDPNVVEISKTAGAVIAFQEMAISSAKFDAAARQFQLDLFNYASSEFTRADGDVQGSLRDAAKLFGARGGGFAQGVDAYSHAMEFGPKVQSLQNALLSHVKRFAEESTPGENSADIVHIAVHLGRKPGEKITTKSRAAVVITNRGTVPIAGLCAVIKMSVDQTRTDEAWQREAAHWEIAGAIETLLDMDRDTRITRQRVRETQLHVFKLGRGAQVYADRLSPGSSLEYDLVSVGTLSQFVNSIDISITTENGKLPAKAYPQSELWEIIKRRL